MNNHLSFDFTGADRRGHRRHQRHRPRPGHRIQHAGAAVTITGTRPTPDDYETDLVRFTYHQVEMTDPSSIDAVREPPSTPLTSWSTMPVPISPAAATSGSRTPSPPLSPSTWPVPCA